MTVWQRLGGWASVGPWLRDGLVLILCVAPAVPAPATVIATCPTSPTGHRRRDTTNTATVCAAPNLNPYNCVMGGQQKNTRMFFSATKNGGTGYQLPDVGNTVPSAPAVRYIDIGWDSSDWEKYLIPETGEPYGGYATLVYPNDGVAINQLILASRHITDYSTTVPFADQAYRNCLNIRAFVDFTMGDFYMEDQYPYWPDPYPVENTADGTNPLVSSQTTSACRSHVVSVNYAGSPVKACPERYPGHWPDHGYKQIRMPEKYWFTYWSRIKTFIDTELANTGSVVIREGGAEGEYSDYGCRIGAVIAMAYLITSPPTMTYEAAKDQLLEKRPCIQEMLSSRWAKTEYIDRLKSLETR